MQKVIAFLKGLFWDKRDLVLQIEALQEKVRRSQKGGLTPEEQETREKQEVSAKEHTELLFEEIKITRRNAARKTVGYNAPVFIANLLGTISVMPKILVEAVTASKLRSERYEREFTSHMETYFNKLCSEMTALSTKFEKDNPDAYLKARVEVAEFLNSYGCYPGMAGTSYRIDALFDKGRRDQNYGIDINLPRGEKDLVTTFRTAVLFFQRALESMSFSETVSPSGVSH